MEIIKTAVYVRDFDFAKALAIGIARESSRMELKVVSGIKGETFDLLITDFDLEEENSVRLVDDPSKDWFQAGPPYCLYRYTDSREMTDALFYMYFRMTGRVVLPRKKGRCRIIVLFSFSGGAGTTTIGISLAKMLYRLYGSRCLYFNLCPVNDSGFILGGTSKTNFLKLLYYLDINKDFPMESFISETEELDYLDTEKFNFHFEEMDQSLLERFAEKTGSLGKYDFIVMDIGDHLSFRTKKLLECADSAVMVLRECDAKNEIYTGEFPSDQNERPSENLLRVINFAGEYDDGEALYVSRAKALNLNENYGTEIGHIAKRIAEDPEDEV